MADENYEGRHEADVPADAAVGTGTPPGIPANVRTIIYVSCLFVDVLAVLVFGLGVVFGAIAPEQAVQASAVIVLAISMISTGLAVGYRPTR